MAVKISKDDIIEVASFPTSNIKRGAIYTFQKNIAKESSYFTHGLHTYPAKFIPQIPRWAIKYAHLEKSDIVLDPYCGCGTTLVEASILGYNSYGLEINPLAKLLTKVKTTPLPTINHELFEILMSSLLNNVTKDKTIVTLEKKQDDINLPLNWKFWYPNGVVEILIKLKRHIRLFYPSKVKISAQELSDLKDFFLICLSVTTKRVSYFDERQIKVRFHKNKFENETPDPLAVFTDISRKQIDKIIDYSRIMSTCGNIFSKIIPTDATNINLDDNLVDLIVTSPPYLNAIDYSMAHKYNMFLLDLIKPEDYSTHCRSYTGVTERAVSKELYSVKHVSEHRKINELIKELYKSGSSTDKIRSYIIWQYFEGITKFLQESYRVLKPGKCCIIVVGDNVIRKRYVPTHMYIRELATRKVGFKLENWFYHKLRNIKLKVNRNETGGLIRNEMVMILRKPGLQRRKIATTGFIKTMDWQFNGNGVKHLTHDFHPYFAKFHPLIVRTLIQKIVPHSKEIIDPYCGCGTTLIEAEILGKNSIGIDANPLACLISRVKTTKIKDLILKDISNRLPVVIKKRFDEFPRSKDLQGKIIKVKPEIFNEKLWFEQNVITELGIIKTTIKDYLGSKKWAEEDINKAYDFCMLALSRIIVPVSNQQTESRYTAVKKYIPHGDVIKRFTEHLNYMIQQIRILNKFALNSLTKVYCADSRNLDFLEEGFFDFLVTSPPYLGSWDYGLYHKFRFLWLDLDVKKFNNLEIGRHLRREGDVINRYTNDMHLCLKGFARVLKKNTHCCIVNANAIVGKKFIDTNKIIIEEAAKSNLVLESIIDRKVYGPHYGMHASLKTKKIKVNKDEIVEEWDRNGKQEQILIFKNH